MTMFSDLSNRVPTYHEPKWPVVKVRTKKPLCFAGVRQEAGYEVSLPQPAAEELVNRGAAEKI